MEANLFLLNVEKDPAEASRIAAETAQRVDSKELKFLDLVKSLAEHLTNEDTTVRAKAIAYLAAVLEKLGPRTLNRNQVPFVRGFLSDRLDDETGVKEAATALTALAKQKWFVSEDTAAVVDALVKIDLPKHPPGTRYKVLELVDYLVANRREDLKAMGDMFVKGLADLVGGEKDPRNLMIVFSVMKVILLEFDIVKHAGIIFDVLYCYFPISFRPPADDPYKITAQDLKIRLRECLASSHYFAGQIFPALIEKLDSTSPSVKLDVLQTIAACSLSYGPHTMSTQSVQIWDAVKFEVLTASTDDDLPIEALNAIRAVATTLSTGLTVVPPPNTALARYLKPIVKECLELLKEPQQKQAKPAGQILAVVASSSISAYAYTVQNTMPALMLILSDADVIAKQRALMEAFNLLFGSAIVIYGSWKDRTAALEVENSLNEYKDTLFGAYCRALMGSYQEEASYRQTAMKGLAAMSQIKDFLEESEIGMVVQHLDEIALNISEKDDMRNEALAILRDISTFRSNQIMQITFPAFMAKLPDSEDEGHYKGTLEALAKLSLERPVFEVLLTRLLNKLDVVLRSGSSSQYPRAILATLLYVLKQRDNGRIEDTKEYYRRLVPTLITKSLLSLVGEGTEIASEVMASDEVLDVTGTLIRVILRDLDTEQQKEALQGVFDLYLHHNPSSLVTEKPELFAEKFRPFDQDSDVRQANCTVLLACALAGARKEVPLPVESVAQFLKQNIQQAERPRSPTHRRAHLHIIGLLVNKWISTADTEHIKEITDKLLEDITADTPDAATDEKLRIVFWIVKALLLRTDKYGMDAIQVLVNLLGSPRIGGMASRGFAVLLGDDDFLNKENYAIVRLLAKQRAFSLCVPLIVAGFRSTSPGTKPNYLIALSNILRNVPTSVITPELPNLLPLLLQSVELPDADVKVATIETLHVTMQESAESLKEHVSSVITRLLNACSLAPASKVGDEEATGPIHNPPRVRMAALRALRSFPGTLRGELLLPYKRQVLKMLLPVLDDPKRAVRKEAVDCRAKWFSMDEPDDN